VDSEELSLQEARSVIATFVDPLQTVINASSRVLDSRDHSTWKQGMKLGKNCGPSTHGNIGLIDGFVVQQSVG
jgi:hypothetical protein